MDQLFKDMIQMDKHMMINLLKSQVAAQDKEIQELQEQLKQVQEQAFTYHKMVKIM